MAAFRVYKRADVTAIYADALGGNKLVGAREKLQTNVVVFCVDANFFLPCAFLVERLAADPDRDRYDIAIIHDGLSDSQIARLSERAGGPIVALSIRAGDGRIVGLSREQPTLAATYFRLLMHRLLPEQYTQILYLDVDIVIERFEIARLFDVELDEAAFAAVRAKHYLWLLGPRPPKWQFDRDRTVDYLLGLGLDLGDHYFNAGVMLINRRQWVELDIPSLAFSFVRDHPELCINVDQSAINAVSSGHSAELSLRWNYPSILVAADIESAIRPVIRHYTGPFKPWNPPAWGADISGTYRTWLEDSGWPGTFPVGKVPLPAAGRPERSRGGWFRRLLSSRARRRRSPTYDKRQQTFEWRPQQITELRHAIIAILTFGRFVDLDPAGRRALIKLLSEVGEEPRTKAA